MKEHREIKVNHSRFTIKSIPTITKLKKHISLESSVLDGVILSPMEKEIYNSYIHAGMKPDEALECCAIMSLYASDNKSWYRNMDW